MSTPEQREEVLARLRPFYEEVTRDWLDRASLDLTSAQALRDILRSALHGTVLEGAEIRISVRTPVWHGGVLLEPGTVEFTVEEKTP